MCWRIPTCSKIRTPHSILLVLCAKNSDEPNRTKRTSKNIYGAFLRTGVDGYPLPYVTWWRILVFVNVLFITSNWSAWMLTKGHASPGWRIGAGCVRLLKFTSEHLQNLISGTRNIGQGVSAHAGGVRHICGCRVDVCTMVLKRSESEMLSDLKYFISCTMIR